MKRPFSLHFHISDWFKVSSKLLAVSAIVGVASGLVAVAFFLLLNGAMDAVFHLANYHPPMPGHEGILPDISTRSRLWLFILPAVGGLVAGLIIKFVAPEAEGGGTEAAIEYFHRHNALVRPRVIIAKALAATATIASGGSAGREGPIAHIGAAIGSLFSRVLKLRVSERRKLYLAGFAGGVAATFRAPLGGAMYAVEVLYRDDFEVDGLMTSIVSAVVAYITFTATLGHGELFNAPSFQGITPLELVGYTILVLTTTLAGFVYVRLLQFVSNKFKSLTRIPDWIRPGIGGLAVGAIGLAVPQVLFIGYGWLQVSMNDGNALFHATEHIPELSIWVLLAIAAFKMLATAFTVGSGGAGGLFAPSMVIGGLLGAAVGQALNALYPGLVPNPASFVLVGMGSFFAGVAKVPLASLIMVSEMTGNYSLLAPMMLTGMLVYVLNRSETIYGQQTATRFDSPAHQNELLRDILGTIKVEQAYRRVDKPMGIPQGTPFSQVLRRLSRSNVPALPVLDDDNRVVGMVSLEYIRSIMFEEGMELLLVARDLCQPALYISPACSLEKAFELFLSTEIPFLLVTNGQSAPILEDIAGYLTPAHIMKAHNKEVKRLRVESQPETPPT